MTGEKNKIAGGEGGTSKGKPRVHEASTSLPSIPSSALSLLFSFLLFFPPLSPLNCNPPSLFFFFFFFYCPASPFYFILIQINLKQTNTFFDCCLFVSYSTVFPLPPVFARGKIVILLISSPFCSLLFEITPVFPTSEQKKKFL